MTSPRTALVTGATGAIGPTLVTHLLTNGWRVKTLSRRAPTGLPSEIEAVGGSINDSRAISEALADVDIVFHLAALLHIENPPPEMEDEYRRINVDGTRLLAEQSASSGAQRFVYFSTVKVYGVHRREPVTEECVPQPKTIYARTKYEGEQVAHGLSGLETVTLRLSPVYGPRVKGSWARLIHAIERGRFIPIGSLRNVHSVTHVDDVVRAALVAACHTDAAGERFNLVAHETPTLEEIFSAIYRSADRSMPPVRIPVPIAYACALIAERALALIGKRSPLPVDALHQLLQDEAYSGEKLRYLGFVPQVPLDQGWSERLGSD